MGRSVPTLGQCLRRVCGGEALHSQTPCSLGAAEAGCPPKGQESGVAGRSPVNVQAPEQGSRTDSQAVPMSSQEARPYGSTVATRQVWIQPSESIAGCGQDQVLQLLGKSLVVRLCLSQAGEPVHRLKARSKGCIDRKGQGSSPPWLRKA